MFFACLLTAFVISRSAVVILLDSCRSQGPNGSYNFVLETVLVVPYMLQMAFYAADVCVHVGFSAGCRSIWNARHDMKPALLYSFFLSCNPFMQALSQAFLDAGTFVVLTQLTLVFVALGETVILGKRSNHKLWSLVILQVCFVCYYQMCANTTSGKSKTHGAGANTELERNRSYNLYIGVVICLSASIINAIGNILQQQFLQTRSLSLPVSIKLWYQHFVGFLLMVASATLRSSTRSAILSNGIFSGWSWSVALTSFCIWLGFLTSSAVTAYISAMAAAMGSAVVVISVGVFSAVVLGRDFSVERGFCVIAIATTTALYTKLKASKEKGTEEHSGISDAQDDLVVANNKCNFRSDGNSNIKFQDV